MTRSLQAIIFDMDGVLVDTEAYHYHAWDQVADALGVPFGPDQMHSFLGRRRRECLLDLLNGMTLNEAEIQHYLKLKDHHFQDAIGTMTGDALLPGVADFIATARAEQLRLGVASSSANARHVLERTGVLAQMDALGDGNTVLRGKPEPDIFLWVAGALKTQPRSVVVFEDSAAGIQAARTAGMLVVAVSSDTEVTGAAQTIANLAQIGIPDLQKLFQPVST
jgi:beta-phosphoglucomutase